MEPSLDIKYNFKIEAVQNIVAETVTGVTKNMVFALMLARVNNLNFKQLVERHITAELKQELAACDEKTNKIYNKVFQATCVHIKNHSQPVDMAINQIALESGKEQAKLFIDSFAFPAVKTMIQKLREEQADAIECDKIWEPSII